MKIDNMTSRQLAAYFDHALLMPYNTKKDFDCHIEECKTYGFYSAAINTAPVSYYAAALRGTDILVGAAVSFPFGQASRKAKLEETKIAVSQGAQEIDYVLNIGRLLDGDYEYIKAEMKGIVDFCHENGLPVKVIFENCYLGETEKLHACEIALEVGIDYVKTSTGFGSGGAEVGDIQLMKRVVGNQVKIKAAGGMRTLKKTAEMIEAGVSRIGSAFGPAIISEFLEMKKRNMTMEQYLASNTLKEG